MLSFQSTQFSFRAIGKEKVLRVNVCKLALTYVVNLFCVGGCDLTDGNAVYEAPPEIRTSLKKSHEHEADLFFTL